MNCLERYFQSFVSANKSVTALPNEKIYIEDTIVASASGEGSAGVNVIRVSGPDTEEIASILLQSLPEPRVATL